MEMECSNTHYLQFFFLSWQLHLQMLQFKDIHLEHEATSSKGPFRCCTLNSSPLNLPARFTAGWDGWVGHMLDCCELKLALAKNTHTANASKSFWSKQQH